MFSLGVPIQLMKIYKFFLVLTFCQSHTCASLLLGCFGGKNINAPGFVSVEGVCSFTESGEREMRGAAQALKCW